MTGGGTKMLTELLVSALQIEILGIKAGAAFVAGHVEEGVPFVLRARRKCLVKGRKCLINTRPSASACGMHASHALTPHIESLEEEEQQRKRGDLCYLYSIFMFNKPYIS